MIVYDLNSGYREYPGYDEIEDRRGGGRGRSRRSDGTYMGYGGGIYDHYGMHEKMKEMDSALHELKDRIDKDPKYKDVKNWLESLPKI